MTRIGQGALGGKAQGLAQICDALESRFSGSEFGWVTVAVPQTTVITTEMFDLFIKRNDLEAVAFGDFPDHRIAHAFQKADLPVELLGDLRAIAEEVRVPLAVRSSSLLEDALYRPFAGVYATKMIPNNQPSKDERFARLVESIKFVYASTYFKRAKGYIRSVDRGDQNEKMAVVVQTIVGQRIGARFYPTVSGVLRSYNFYPTGHARPEDGVCTLALGLGRTIVEGEPSWSFSPAFPKAPPPFNDIGDLLKFTQLRFWAVHMGPPQEAAPSQETEYLVEGDLQAADYDNTLRFVASTYDHRSDRIVPGVGAKGPRLLNFAPLLSFEQGAVVDLFKSLLEMGEQVVGGPVEIEFALDLNREKGFPAKLGFLQIRPMVVSAAAVDVSESKLKSEQAVLASTHTLGNGVEESIQDVVYLIPEAFALQSTPQISAQVAAINQKLMAEGRPYVLIGFGRWGTSDPWCGVPVEWEQIAGAKVMVEVPLAQMNPEMSQGSHFFHNVTSFEVFYFSLDLLEKQNVDWSWLERQPEVEKNTFVRHVRPTTPLSVRVDGKRKRGVILRNEE
jgi:hypothetical protein